MVLADVTQLRVAVTDKQDTRKLDQAIQALAAALQPRAWLDDSHLQDRLGDGVFSETRTAVNALVLLMRDRRSTVEDDLPLAFITRLVQADRVIPVVAIEEAQAAATDPKDVVKARIHFALGDALATRELYGAAIECYSNAWRNVAGP